MNKASSAPKPLGCAWWALFWAAWLGLPLPALLLDEKSDAAERGDWVPGTAEVIYTVAALAHLLLVLLPLFFLSLLKMRSRSGDGGSLLTATALVSGALVVGSFLALIATF